MLQVSHAFLGSVRRYRSLADLPFSCPCFRRHTVRSPCVSQERKQEDGKRRPTSAIGRKARQPRHKCCVAQSTTAHLHSGQCTAAGSTQMGQEQGCCSKIPTASEPGATAGQPQRLHVSPRTVPVKASKPATASQMAGQKLDEKRDLSSSGGGVGVGGGASSPVIPPTTSGLSVVSVGQLVMHFSGAGRGGAGSGSGGGGGAKPSRRDDEITYNVNVLNAVNPMWSHSDDDRVDDLVNRWSTLEIVYLKVRAAP